MRALIPFLKSQKAFWLNDEASVEAERLAALGEERLDELEASLASRQAALKKIWFFGLVAFPAAISFAWASLWGHSGVVWCFYFAALLNGSSFFMGQAQKLQTQQNRLQKISQSSPKTKIKAQTLERSCSAARALRRQASAQNRSLRVFDIEAMERLSAFAIAKRASAQARAQVRQASLTGENSVALNHNAPGGFAS